MALHFPIYISECVFQSMSTSVESVIEAFKSTDGWRIGDVVHAKRDGEYYERGVLYSGSKRGSDNNDIQFLVRFQSPDYDPTWAGHVDPQQRVKQEKQKLLKTAREKRKGPPASSSCVLRSSSSSSSSSSQQEDDTEEPKAKKARKIFVGDPNYKTQPGKVAYSYFLI